MVPLRSTVFGALAFVTAALAQSSSTPVSSFCSSSTASQAVCGAINVPSSGSDTFFQVAGPTSGGWAAVGIGSGMAGALIFVIYPSSDGSNVTVSPRLGRGHVQPQHTSDVQIQLLAGSGVSDGIMRATFKCSNCRSWSGGGELDITSNNQMFIWASGPGSSIRSDQPDEDINQHRSEGRFQLDVAKATGGDGSTNPFTATASSSGNNTTNTGGSSVGSSRSKADKVLIAHGVIMALTWVILFPLGAAFIRLLSDRIPNAVAAHRTLQLFNVCLAIVGMAMGMWTSDLNSTHFKQFHQYFGVVLIGMLFVQAALGQLHHATFKQIKKRSAWSYMHIWTGRVVIALAIINGGIGLGPKLADASTGQIAAYSVVVVLVVGTYFTFYFLQRRRRVEHKA